MNSHERPMYPEFPAFDPGEVWLVGAGPGDPRLLTLMAVHALRSCDVVVHDELIDPRVLGYLRPGADIESAGKRGGKPSPHQSDINERLIVLARDEQARAPPQRRRSVRLRARRRRGAFSGARGRTVPHRARPDLGPRGSGAGRHPGNDARDQPRRHPRHRAPRHRRAFGARMGGDCAHRPTGHPLHGHVAPRRDCRRLHARRHGPRHARRHHRLGNLSRAERVLQTELHRAADDAKANDVGAPAVVVVGRIAALRAELLANLAGATP